MKTVNIPVVKVRSLDVFEDSCCLESGALARGDGVLSPLVCKFCGKTYFNSVGGKLFKMGYENKDVTVEDDEGEDE